MWSASDPEKRSRIIKQLIDGDKGFNEICDLVGMGRQTLNVYLKYLVREKYIKRTRQGKSVIYSIERDHPYVLSLLNRVRILRKIKLSGLDAEEFLMQWIRSIEFAFLNVIQDYIQMGAGVTELKSRAGGHTRPIEKFLEEHLSDMSEVYQFYGEFLSDRIRRGEIEPEKMWTARNQLLSRIKKDRALRAKKAKHA